jgi:hypothetical protein
LDKLGYPHKETELEIIRVNCPEYKLSDNVLDSIYGLVSATRTNTDIEIPASIRAGISIARLTAEMAQREKKEITHELLSYAAHHVLIGGLKFRPGIDPEPAVSLLVSRALGSGRRVTGDEEQSKTSEND